MTTIHLGDCSTDCPICVANCECGNCLIKCRNCGYEISEASNKGFCDNCERAFQLGREGVTA